MNVRPFWMIRETHGNVFLGCLGYYEPTNEKPLPDIGGFFSTSTEEPATYTLVV
jgi:hypothetical protein